MESLKTQNPKSKIGAPSGPPKRQAKQARPRIGFLGVGWIGRRRMEAIAKSGLVEVAAIADPVEDNLREAALIAPGAALASDPRQLLRADLDGIVIATPSALHAEQATLSLQQGVAVFCQKPLARTGDETSKVVEAARGADRLLGVDLSYRHISGMRRIKELVQAGELGQVFAVNLVFHNAYGPDKPWFYDINLSGGGCVIDLGIHLVDLALWTLGLPKVTGASSRLYAGGERLRGNDTVEDYALATLDLESGATLELACSWKLQAGREAVIEASFYGTQGGASLRNVNGSFYDFKAERFRGTTSETLVEPPDDWGGRAAVEWARSLAKSSRYDPAIESIVEVAGALDRIYGR